MEILENFNQKTQEIYHYFDLIRYLEDKREINTSFKVSPSLHKTLKANGYLLLYNLVEGSIVEGIDAIFIDINNKNVMSDKLTDCYKQIWLEYKSQLIKSSKNKRESVKTLGKNFSEILAEIQVFNILTFTDKENKKLENYSGYLKITDVTQ